MPVSAIIVGAGHRAMLYASYAKLHPEALTIVGVADPDPIRRKKAAACYRIRQDMCFESAEALAARPKLADAIINGTMDTQHVSTAIPLLRAGYHMLLEKPFAVNEAEMWELVRTARETGRRMDLYEGLTYMDRDFVYRFLQPAADFIAEHDLPLYCGEYGVIDEADPESRAAWTQDVAAFCTQHGIGRALWSYRGMNFRLVDDETKQPVSAALLRAAVRR